MWQDMGLYWAWRGKEKPDAKPPTTKRVEYAEITHTYRYLNGDKKGEFVRSSLAVGVWDDDRYTPLNRGDSACEVEWFKRHGATVEMPSNAELKGGA